MSMPNRAARKAAAITDTASKTRTSAGIGSNRVARTIQSHDMGGKDRGPVYKAPKPVRPKPVKK